MYLSKWKSKLLGLVGLILLSLSYGIFGAAPVSSQAASLLPEISDSDMYTVQSSVYGQVYLQQALAFSPSPIRTETVAPMPIDQYSISQSTLPDRRTLVIGTGIGRLAVILIYNPASNAWTQIPTTLKEFYGHAQSTLPDGRILVTGGSETTAVYLYDPLTNTWSRAADLPIEIRNHTQSVLNDGRVLLVGGRNKTSVSNSSYIYDPKTNTWTKAANLPKTTWSAAQSTLPDGRVLLTGGSTDLEAEYYNISNKALLYNPKTNSWEYASDLPVQLSVHKQVTLQDGRVLALKGGTGYTYDSGTNTWSSFGVFPAGAEILGMNVFQDGRVMVNTRTLSPSTRTTYILTYNAPPTLSVDQTDQLAWFEEGHRSITLSGSLNDVNNDTVTVSATIAGVTKSVVVPNSNKRPLWSLRWDTLQDNLAPGTYTSIPVTVHDGTDSNTAAYNGTIVIDRAPNIPANTAPGGNTVELPQTIATETPVLSWTFTDPDAGDKQSAYQIVVSGADGVKLYDSGWVLSEATTFTVPSAIMQRGKTVGWSVRTKDQIGVPSSFSSIKYVKQNALPVAQWISYTDNQTLNENVLNFSWKYSDSEQQPQTDYQIIGSKDGWKTWGYNTGEIKSGATVHTTKPLESGAWSFKVRVKDGLEWSDWATRSNLMLPNTYEPNDTFEQAYLVNSNQSYASTIGSASDVDFFKYKAKTTGVDRLQLNVPDKQNYDVYIYDAGKKLIAAGIREGNTAENVLYEVSEGSEYYFKIVSANNGADTASYSFIVGNLNLNSQTNYDYDRNGNLIKKTTSTQGQIN
ncbi:Kelch repeat-containing protein [Paenibacillus chitinolyticus]|uniref:Kelch repeat-containing protein n=1 Tax=Paenibacillus chitinolyticus TaxID=79263 RepID=UPI00386C2E4B